MFNAKHFLQVNFVSLRALFCDPSHKQNLQLHTGSTSCLETPEIGNALAWRACSIHSFAVYPLSLILSLTHSHLVSLLPCLPQQQKADQLMNKWISRLCSRKPKCCSYLTRTTRRCYLYLQSPPWGFSISYKSLHTPTTSLEKEWRSSQSMSQTSLITVSIFNCTSC